MLNAEHRAGGYAADPDSNVAQAEYTASAAARRVRKHVSGACVICKFTAVSRSAEDASGGAT